MEDARKSAAAAALRPDQDAKPTNEERSESFVAFLNEPGEAQVGTDSTSNRALDRWFKERQKHQGAPRLLEIPNEALITAGGPIQITGNITLVNEDGSIRYANHLTLCRCGSSQTKPECSGAHLDREFLHPGARAACSRVSLVSFDVISEMAIGTSCRFCSRLWAVTTIASSNTGFSADSWGAASPCGASSSRVASGCGFDSS